MTTPQYTNEQVANYMRNVAGNFVLCGMVLCVELAQSAAKVFFVPVDDMETFDTFVDIAFTVYGGPFCQDKKSTRVKIQNPPALLTRNLEGQVHFMPL